MFGPQKHLYMIGEHWIDHKMATTLYKKVPTTVSDLFSFPSFHLFPPSFILTHLFLLWLGLLQSLLPALTCTSLNQTVVLLPGGMCADETKALPCTGPTSEKVKAGRSEAPRLCYKTQHTCNTKPGFFFF